MLFMTMANVESQISVSCSVSMYKKEFCYTRSLSLDRSVRLGTEGGLGNMDRLLTELCA